MKINIVNVYKIQKNWYDIILFSNEIIEQVII